MATDLEYGTSTDPLEREVSGDMISTNGALEALNRSEIDIQIRTAKAYPRSIKEFKRQAIEMACMDEDTAGSMFYVLKRGGKPIEGPSVRLAEVVGSAFGNLRYGARIVGTDDKFVTAQGACHDLEKNTAATVEIKRRITDKHGRRFNDDMVQVTSNAACSIALRQAIFKVVPFAFVKSIYDQAKLTSIGEVVSINKTRRKMLDWYRQAGATDEQVLAYLGRPGVDDITLDDVVMMRGLMTAIKDGETTIEEALQVEQPSASKVRTSKLNERMTEPTKQPEAAQEPQDEPESDPESQEIDGEQILALARQRLSEAKDLMSVTRIYDELCGPDSVLDEAQQQRGKEMCEMRNAEIKAGRGSKRKDGLFEKTQTATEAGH